MACFSLFLSKIFSDIQLIILVPLLLGYYFYLNFEFVFNWTVSILSLILHEQVSKITFVADLKTGKPHRRVWSHEPQKQKKMDFRPTS